MRYSLTAQASPATPVMTLDNINRTLERLFREGASDLIVQIPEKDEDAFEMLFRLDRLAVDPFPRVYLILDRPLPFALPSYVVSCFFPPVSPQNVAQWIESFQPDIQIRTPPERMMDRYCSEMLLRLGISPHLRGFRLLRLALLYLLNQPSGAPVSMMYELYPAVSEQTGKPVPQIEHSMRHAIETGWLRADLREIESFFGYTTRDDKPTPSNSAFLMTVAERIRLRLFDRVETDTISREMQRLDAASPADLASSVPYRKETM